MSSILKALRRLEEDRARKSSSAPEIAASLLRSNTRRRSASSWIWPVLATVAVSVVVLLVLLWLWRPQTATSEIVPSQSSPSPQLNSANSGRGGEIIIEEVIDQRRPVLPSPTSVSISPAVTPPVNVKCEVNIAEQMPPSSVVPNNLMPTPVEERLNPVVSAIIWQDDSAARMAVIDGLPVMTGEMIGSVKVQEIRRDRIIFVEGAVPFAVRLITE